MKPFWRAREFSTVAILAFELLFFTWYLWPTGGGSHPFFNFDNFVLIFKYSSIYGIAAIGAAIVIISGLIDLAPGAIIGLTSVITGYFFVVAAQRRDLGGSADEGGTRADGAALLGASVCVRRGRSDGPLHRRQPAEKRAG